MTRLLFIILPLSVANRKRVIVLRRLGYSLNDIKHRLEEDNLYITIRSLQRLCKKFHNKHTIKDLHCMSRTRKLSQEMSTLLDDILKENDEMTATQIREKLYDKFPDLNFFLHGNCKASVKEEWVSLYPTTLLPTNLKS